MRIKLHVCAGSKTFNIQPLDNGSYKLKIKSPPIDGKANKEIVQYFAKVFKIAKSDIKIIVGQYSKNKIIDIPIDENVWENFIQSQNI